MRIRVLAVMVAVAAGCGEPPHWDGDPDLYGVLVVDESSAHVTEAPDFRERFRRTLETSADYIGMPLADLEGLRVVLADAVRCAGRDTTGCYSEDERTVWIDVTLARCPESGTLSHELLHVAIGDPSHSDQRWSGAYFDPLYDRLLNGHVACQEPWR